MTPDSLSELMAQAARELEQQPSLESTMQAAVDIAVRDLDGAEAAGLSIVVDRHQVQTLAATSREVRRGDVLQYDVGEGPCLDAVWEERIVYSPDLTHEHRWPLWAERASRETGYRSLLAFQLFTTHERVGALNLYSTQVNGFGATDRDLGWSLAAHISVAVRSAQEIEQLQAALDSRTVIAQAVGRLMERYDMTPEGAFSFLARVSSTTNTKLRDIAADLCSTGSLPHAKGLKGGWSRGAAKPARADQRAQRARPSPPQAAASSARASESGASTEATA
jgi:GAF domain-containing protein